jgi:superfamily I DNA/RNA helicase
VGEQVRVGQVGEEQQSVNAMHALLHNEVSARRAAQERATAAPVDGPSDRQAATHLSVTEESIPSTLNSLITHVADEHPGELIGVIATTERSPALEAEIHGAGATIVAAPEARGLEFDTVIIVDPAGLRAAGEAGPRDLYVAQTRATKRLLTLTTGA